MMFETPETAFAAPQVAVVREAFDEQAAKREWDEACADEQDAMARKAAVLQAALRRWPMVLGGITGKQMVHVPEMRRFVRDVLGMPDAKDGGLNHYAWKLLRQGSEGIRAQHGVESRKVSSARKLRRVVTELTAKYRQGADPAECMEALTKYYEGLANGEA